MYFWGLWFRGLATASMHFFLRGESVLMGDSLSRVWIRSHHREMMTQCKRTPAVGVPLTSYSLLTLLSFCPVCTAVRTLSNLASSSLGFQLFISGVRFLWVCRSVLARWAYLQGSEMDLDRFPSLWRNKPVLLNKATAGELVKIHLIALASSHLLRRSK